MAHIQAGMSQLGIDHDAGPRTPAMLDVLASSINIMQVLITRSRLAGEPADVLMTPSLADLGLMEFHRAGIAIDAGRRAVEAAMPQLQARLLNDSDGV
jgi:NTE family protein